MTRCVHIEVHCSSPSDRPWYRATSTLGAVCSAIGADLTRRDGIVYPYKRYTIWIPDADCIMLRIKHGNDFSIPLPGVTGMTICVELA